jgi:hypothetical protein
MSSHQIALPIKDEHEDHSDQRISQHKQPEAGRYLLLVDRQNKGAYPTSAAAEKKGLEIKSGYPILQVSVYDRVEYVSKIL